MQHRNGRHLVERVFLFLSGMYRLCFPFYFSTKEKKKTKKQHLMLCNNVHCAYWGAMRERICMTMGQYRHLHPESSANTKNNSFISLLLRLLLLLPSNTVLLFFVFFSSSSCSMCFKNRRPTVGCLALLFLSWESNNIRLFMFFLFFLFNLLETKICRQHLKSRPSSINCLGSFLIIFFFSRLFVRSFFAMIDIRAAGQRSISF